MFNRGRIPVPVQDLEFGAYRRNDNLMLAV
jgi:hypothetical protein